VLPLLLLSGAALLARPIASLQENDSHLETRFFQAIRLPIAERAEVVTWAPGRGEWAWFAYDPRHFTGMG